MKKKILFVMPSLGGGGGERVITSLANNLNREKFEIYLYLFFSGDKESNQYLDYLKKDVNVKCFGMTGRVRYNLPFLFINILKYIWKIKPYSFLISSGGYNALMAPILQLAPRSMKKISRESNLPSLHESTRTKMLNKMFYRLYDRIVVQSDDMMNDMMKNANLSTELLYKINNPVDAAFIQASAAENNNYTFDSKIYNMVTAGRLTHQKGFDLLIEYCSKLNKDKTWKLYILGGGEDKEKLAAIIAKYDLGEYVELVGHVNNPHPYIKNADLFISSSRWEGFPNVVIESLVCGTPVFANNYPGGINEIITDDVGAVFDFSKDFERGLEFMRSKKWDSEKISNYTIKKYGADIFEKYEFLLSE